MDQRRESETLLEDLRRLAGKRSPGAADLQAALEKVIACLGCQLGTVHVLHGETGPLELLAHQGIPPVVLERILSVPVGKGLAGLAAERREPVEVCNLQTDASGVARPAAKQTGSQGSIAVPMLHGGELRGVLGVGKSAPHDFTRAEKALLLQVGEVLAAWLR